MLMHPDIGVLNGGKCYVFLEGYGLHREPMYGTYEECLGAIDARGGVDDPIPTDSGHTMGDYKAAVEQARAVTTPFMSMEPKSATPECPEVRPAPTTRNAMREYVLTFRVIDEEWQGVDGYRDGQETVYARDRNEAMRKGRDILRDNVGPYRPKMSINARLSN